MHAAAKTDVLLELWTRARARRAVHTEREDVEALLGRVEERAEARDLAEEVAAAAEPQRRAGGR